MKRILLTIAVLALGAGVASAQDREIDLQELDELNKIELSKDGSRVNTELHLAFPMYFGASTLTNLNYKGDWDPSSGLVYYHDFLKFRTGKNFVYALQLAEMEIRGDMLSLSLGLRWTFMDFTFSDPSLTLRPYSGLQFLSSAAGSNVYVPVPVSSVNPSYDLGKSKIHASYFGIPLRVGLNFGKATLYAGASAELLTGGYAKFKRPKDRQQIREVFNPFRATVEGGFSYGNLGVFVMYGLTPLFQESLSDARTISFGLLLGL